MRMICLAALAASLATPAFAQDMQGDADQTEAETDAVTISGCGDNADGMCGCVSLAWAFFFSS